MKLCTVCGQPHDEQGVMCEPCKEKHRERGRRYRVKGGNKRRYRRAKVNKICANCPNPCDSQRVLCIKCRERQSKSDRLTKQMRKRQIIEGYGGVCSCCGEHRLPFLTIDHIDNSGSEHRKRLGNNHLIYKELIDQRFPSGHRVLCWNCNSGRQINGGICPHEEERIAKTT